MQDNVPPFSSDTAVSIIEQGLGGRVEEIYEEFDRQPIAAASLGQVNQYTFMFLFSKPGRAHAYLLMEFPIQGPCLYRACRGNPPRTSSPHCQLPTQNFVQNPVQVLGDPAGVGGIFLPGP
jgi:hypothetical protein